MRRKRFQKGSVRPRKHGRHKVWVGQWWEGDCRRSKVLGDCSEMSKGQAEAIMASILEPLNEGAGKKTARTYTFHQYLEEVFLPICRRKWKESTRMTSEPLITYHLLPALGHRLLAEVTRDEMQALLDKKAKTLSVSVVAHLRWHLSAIFRTALGDGAVQFNPTLGLYVPRCQEGRERRVLERGEILQALNALGPRERIIFRMAVFDGMRPGEILAIRVENVQDHSVHIKERVYKGNLDTPKGRRGRRTDRVVALSPGTLTELKNWIASLADKNPRAFVFPSENHSTPVSRDNLWRREIGPKLREIGLEWATFQVLRRTNASLSRVAMIDDKVAADQRGHGLGVSLDVYAISDLRQKIDAVTRLESSVIQ